MLQVVDIACGSLHSACITEDGALYTWGKGKYGRLGHGNNDDKMVPTKVTKVSEILGSCCWDIKCGCSSNIFHSISGTMSFAFIYLS